MPDYECAKAILASLSAKPDYKPTNDEKACLMRLQRNADSNGVELSPMLRRLILNED